MTRRLAFVLVLSFAVASSFAAEPLNVLLILSDDLRDTVGCYGNAQAKTPNLDRLALRGVRFERAYAQYPVCNPSRTSCLTGLRCEQTGVTGNTTFFRTKLPDIVTMPQLLRQQGWYAASYGKIYHIGEAMGESREGWFDLGKSWDEAMLFHPTAEGKVLEGRNLTGGALKWCHWGATAGSDDDQPDGQTAQHSIATIEKFTAQGKSPVDGVAVQVEAKLVVKENFVECAIPWSELPEVKAQMSAGQPVKFSFRVNNGGTAFELAAGRSVSKQNPLTFHNDWSTHQANEVEFGWEP